MTSRHDEKSRHNEKSRKRRCDERLERASTDVAAMRFVLTGQVADPLLKQLREMLQEMVNAREQPSADGEPRRLVKRQEELTSKTRYLVLGTRPSEKVMDEAYRQFRLHFAGRRACRLDVVYLPWFVERLPRFSLSEEPELERGAGVWAERYFGADVLVGFHALPSWNYDMGDEDVVFTERTGCDRFSTGGHLDALLCLSDLPCTPTAPQFSPLLRRVGPFTLTWSARYAAWGAPAIAQSLVSRDEDVCRRVLNVCNGKAGLLGELLRRLRRCEVVHEPGKGVQMDIQLIFASTNGDLPVLARVVSHVLLQHRAALASFAALEALRAGDREQAVRICQAHDAREKCLCERYKHMHFPDYTDECGNTWAHLGEFGIPLLGTWMLGYGDPQSAEDVRKQGLVLVDGGRPSYDMPARSQRQRDLSRLFVEGSSDPEEALMRVVVWHLEWRRYARVFPSRVIGAFAHFLTEELPQRCEALLPHIGAAFLRACGDDVDVQVATWAAFGCPRSTRAFTQAGGPGRRAKDEFPDPSLGGCLPMDNHLMNLVPKQHHRAFGQATGQARPVAIPDVLAMVTDHLALMTWRAGSTTNPGTWGGLLSAVDPKVTTESSHGGKVRVSLEKEAVADAAEEKALERSWAALSLCVGEDARVRNFKSSKKGRSMSFTMAHAQWNDAHQVATKLTEECRGALEAAATLRDMRNRTTVSDDWRPSPREFQRQEQAKAAYKKQWLRKREADRIARGKAMAKSK